MGREARATKERTVKSSGQTFKMSALEIKDEARIQKADDGTEEEKE